MSQTIYREEGKTRCPACQRSVAAIRTIVKESGGVSVSTNAFVARHLYQEQVQLNEVGAPTRYADGFCPGSFHPAQEVIRK